MAHIEAIALREISSLLKTGVGVGVIDFYGSARINQNKPTSLDDQAIPFGDGTNVLVPWPKDFAKIQLLRLNVQKSGGSFGMVIRPDNSGSVYVNDQKQEGVFIAPDGSVTILEAKKAV